ncbi:MAG: hypothetical protein JSR80_02395 [Verrucomicrobia bacterium]|nr:hypothetical protein [Verrucomicrobiota bacterium]
MTIKIPENTGDFRVAVFEIDGEKMTGEALSEKYSKNSDGVKRIKYEYEKTPEVIKSVMLKGEAVPIKILKTGKSFEETTFQVSKEQMSGKAFSEKYAKEDANAVKVVQRLHGKGQLQID